jgi:ribonucleoside-diphosphate reductase alpha chain
MTTTIMVTKRDGRQEPLDLEKFHRVASWACEGLAGVSQSEVELKTNIQFYNGIATSDIQEILIKSAADLISEASPNYQYVAGRLINYHLRKQVYGGPEIPSFLDHVTKCVELGRYDPELLDMYSEEEFRILDTMIDHNRDFSLTYAAMEQLRGKYLVKDRVTEQFFETPQMAFMAIAATLFSKYPKKTLKWVKEFYDSISTFDISLPTPIMAGVRTPQRQFSSCVVIESGDSLDSISASTSAIVKYVSQRAGIGIGGGRIRAIHSPVRGGLASHTGVIPFYKMFAAAVGSCSQGGVRNGAATLYYPIFHLEIEDLIVLKNNKGTEESRIRTIDYAVQLNKLFYERFLADGNITLFSPGDVPTVMRKFFTDDVEGFKFAYEAAEADETIRKKTVRARDLFSKIMQERKDTGRIYIMNVDHCNSHSSFYDAVTMSNLCVEINLPTTPMGEPDEEIALCTLSAVNWGKIREPEDFEKPCRLAVRALDELISYQNYPVKAAEKAMARRSLGIGIINFAYWLAKNDISYSKVTPEQLQEIHRYAEAWSYYLIRASVDLAKEKGACELSDRTKYSNGILPIDTYKRELDELVKPAYHMDWDGLREDLRKYGIRNSTLMALMPAETSCAISNATNGIEPARDLVSVKQSKHGVLKQVVPEIRRLKNKYDLLWNQESPVGYLKICAVLQKFIDQSISVNTSYNPKHYANDELPMSELIRDMMLHYKWGGKTLYYFNTFDGAGEIDVHAQDEETCDSCAI